MEAMTATMTTPAPISVTDPTFAWTIQARSHEPVTRCFYCQKCSIGCPTAFAMDYQPAQVLKMVQLGQKGVLLNSRAIWLCIGCETCGTRCPNDIRVNNVMDVLKEIALEEGAKPAEKTVYALHRSFLNSIKRFGRLHELTMLAEYILHVPQKLPAEIGIGWALFVRGKVLHLWSAIKERGAVRKLFDRAGL
ncbi:MAG: 4Fe-4S dicluster domain-containing protein [Anaerolineae bacterium]|nr:MAG: 4Fe-4S dicluster domain-containing protein [Anaerolineae bacterium]